MINRNVTSIRLGIQLKFYHLKKDPCTPAFLRRWLMTVKEQGQQVLGIPTGKYSK